MLDDKTNQTNAFKKPHSGYQWLVEMLMSSHKIQFSFQLALRIIIPPESLHVSRLFI